jgi:hypothetical protein
MDMRMGCHRKNSSAKCREQAVTMRTTSVTSTSTQPAPSAHLTINWRRCIPLCGATPPPSMCGPARQSLGVPEREQFSERERE